MSAPVRYDALYALKLESKILDMVREASREAGCKPQQWVRSAVAMALTMQGYDTTDKPGGK